MTRRRTAFSPVATRHPSSLMRARAKVVASITNGTRVDALGWDPSKKLIYIPNGGEGNVTVVHQDSPDKYTVVATVATFAGAKTIAVDPTTHNVYLFQPERGPAPAPPAGAPPPAAGRDVAAVRRVRSSLRGLSSSSSNDSAKRRATRDVKHVTRPFRKARHSSLTAAWRIPPWLA